MGTMFQAAATEGAKAQRWRCTWCVLETRLLSWNMGLHTEIVGNRVRGVGSKLLVLYTSGLPTNAC